MTDQHRIDQRVEITAPVGTLIPTVVLVDDGLAERLRPLLDVQLRVCEALLAPGGPLADLAARSGWTPEALAWRGVLAGLVTIVEDEGYDLSAAHRP